MSPNIKNIEMKNRKWSRRYLGPLNDCTYTKIEKTTNTQGIPVDRQQLNLNNVYPHTLHRCLRHSKTIVTVSPFAHTTAALLAIPSIAMQRTPPPKQAYYRQELAKAE